MTKRSPPHHNISEYSWVRRETLDGGKYFGEDNHGKGWSI
jgi:hypothetical protein